ncbi:histidine kinase [Sulfurimonas denitrificans DSM 1251]|jgi:signal transduction histidine kinase|uniref:histidine kinase n=1 Tax=Sulfurimonas denitrificans (strain ATCC 33889 / DSM 1251) TaxID=326298 RepID=Q30QJ5_SULDN|nr:HAMP domain-containing sensor histidine kinase [Sulfurimonas denitrificans]ABB44736.1 histidine kinase [Sulfurimonas denitrificans DSM 1251]MDD3443028.1 HAMP domain-containing sensor histidine kinase [Sulfurimonas denitrificans]
MRIKSRFQNISIKQADVFTILVVFFFTLVFVGLLVEELYKEYEIALEQSHVVKNPLISDSTILKQNQKKLKALLIKTVLAIVTLSFIIFAIFLGLNTLFNKLLQRDTQTFLDAFKTAIDKEKTIDSKSIFFQDFKMMVGYANEMVSKINEQKKNLKELNLGLEERVKKKTAALLEINKNLEEEKTFSQDLLKSQKEFLRYTVHETNTPLSVILTSIELYLMKNPKDRQLSKIEAATKNIFSIYDDLSYLVKKDHVEYTKSVINLNNFLSSRIDFFREVAEFSLITFNYNSPKYEKHVHFNETKLQRIIDNTLTNAIKYTLPNESVEVSLKKIGSYIEFIVSSKSKTIQDTDKVFEAYYREEKGRDGFGLGLRLVKSICDAEGVNINVSSDEASTTFRYKFKAMGD